MQRNDHRNASHLMKLVHHLRAHRLRVLHSEDAVYPGQASVLFCLRRRQEMSQRELAAYLDQTPASMTVTLGRMEKSGLIVRAVDTKDRRIQRVCITDRGLEFYQRAQAAENIADAELFAGFSDDEMTQLNMLLAHCVENMSAATGRPKQGDNLYEEFRRHVGHEPTE